jgi:large subunit ribosomal protein L32
MAVPKRKMSRARTRHRRANWLRLRPTTTVECPRCKQQTRPHTVCGACGTYDGKVVLDV